MKEAPGQVALSRVESTTTDKHNIRTIFGSFKGLVDKIKVHHNIRKFHGGENNFTHIVGNLLGPIMGTDEFSNDLQTKKMFEKHLGMLAAYLHLMEIDANFRTLELTNELGAYPNNVLQPDQKASSPACYYVQMSWNNLFNQKNQKSANQKEDDHPVFSSNEFKQTIKEHYYLIESAIGDRH